MSKKAAMLAASLQKPSFEDHTAPQTSFRLNVLVLAKLKALADMYPHSMNDLVNKLLDAALEEFEEGMRGEYYGTEHEGTPQEIARYEGDEQIREFKQKTEQHGFEILKKLEKKR